MRAAQDFDSVERTKLAQRIARTRSIDAVDEDRDRAFEAGIVADRADPADSGRAIGLVACRRDEQRGSHLIEIANIGRARAFELGSGDGRHGHRHVGKFLLAPLRGDDDAVFGLGRIVGLLPIVFDRSIIDVLRHCGEAQPASEKCDGKQRATGVRDALKAVDHANCPLRYAGRCPPGIFLRPKRRLRQPRTCCQGVCYRNAADGAHRQHSPVRRDSLRAHCPTA